MRVASIGLRLLPVSFLAVAAAPAPAAFIAVIADDAAVSGGGDTIATDQGAGDNFPGSAIIGQINAGAVNVGGFTIVTNVAQSKPASGSASNPQMSISFSATTSDSSSHTVYLFASDNGFTGSGVYSLSLGGTQATAGSGNTITGSAWGGSSIANLDFTHLITQGNSSLSPFTIATSGAFSPTFSPYALTIGIAITRTSAGTTTGDLNFSIPEPTTATLLAAAAGIGLLRRQRRTAISRA